MDALASELRHLTYLLTNKIVMRLPANASKYAVLSLAVIHTGLTLEPVPTIPTNKPFSTTDFVEK